MNFHHRLAILVAFVTCAGVLGCGGKATGDLTGAVKYKGKAVVSGTVTVYDADKKAYQGGIDQGAYTVKGVPEGPVEVVVISPNAKGSEVQRDERSRPGREKRPDAPDAAAPVTGWFALPKKYEDASTSPLKTTVKAGSNTFDLELKD